MSKAEILDELPRLSAADRAEVLARLWALKEAAEPTEAVNWYADISLTASNAAGQNSRLLSCV